MRHRILGIIVACACVAAIVRASSVHVRAHPSSDSELRLAWSARPERVEDCRQRSEEELARLPQHMRQALACEGTTAAYRLQVSVEGKLIVDRVVRGGGMRHDRRLYVLEEVPISPGDRGIQVRFDRIGAAGPSTPAAAAHLESVPAHLDLEQRITFHAREVVLVTYSSDMRDLVVTSGPSASER
jgi:hypothetical protein